MKLHKLTQIICIIIATSNTIFAFPHHLPTKHVPHELKSLIAINRPDPKKQISISLTLPLQNTNELKQLLSEIYNPNSKNFRHYISQSEFATKYGQSQSNYDQIITFCKKNKLTVTATQPNKTTITVTGDIQTIESVFHTKIKNFQHPTENRVFFAPETEPTLESPLNILHIAGLNNFHRPKSHIKQKVITNLKENTITSNTGSGSNGILQGKDFQNAYAPGITLNGSGQNIALVEFDGFYATDITSYQKKANLPTNTAIQIVKIDGYNTAPGSGNGEVALDIEVALAMAPNIKSIIVYEQSIDGSIYNILNQIAVDNTAKQISCSWTWTGYEAAIDQVFMQYAAQGQSFFNASGDYDAYAGTISIPADSAYVTVVGGTRLTMNGTGESWANETTWNDGNGTGSSGGISTITPIPNWQQGINMITNRGSTQYRNLPDVAIVAANVLSIANNGVSYNTIGTSIAAPLWAAFTALANQKATMLGKPSVGFINPIIYQATKNKTYPNSFHDITTGDNIDSNTQMGFYATKGYDLCTGLGTPTGSNTINMLLQLPTTSDPTDHINIELTSQLLAINTPIKTIITAQTITNTTDTTYTNTLTLTASQTITNYLFNKDFEHDTIKTLLTDWKQESTTLTPNIAYIGANNNGHSLTITGGDTTNSYNGVSHTLTNITPANIEFYVRTITNTTAAGYFVIGTDKYRSNSIAHFRMDQTQTMGLTDGIGNFFSLPYIGNIWYKINLQVNWINKTIDYSVNDVIVTENIPFCNTNLNYVSTINLYNFDNTQSWWDQISLQTTTTNTEFELQPTNITPTNGIWNGYITMNKSATNIKISASDNKQHTGQSNPIDLAAPLIVTTSPTSGGINFTTNYYIVGTTNTITAPTNQGWAFQHWQDGNTQNPRNIIMPQNETNFIATVGQLPNITKSITNTTATPDTLTTFSITTPTNYNYIISWYKNSKLLPNETNNTYTIKASTSDSGSIITCKIANDNGYITATATLIVNPQLEITKNTKEQTIINLNGAIGSYYTIFTSTNLADWNVLTNIQLLTPTTCITNNISKTSQFFRATTP